MASVVTPAVVLRTVDYGEADRVVTLLTQQFGKVSALARGARRSVKRFGAGLSLFGVGEATLTERRSAELYRLDHFHGARGFPHLLDDVAKLAHGGYACELVRELSPAGQPEPAVFELLVTLLAMLDQSPARAETLRVFELRLLDAVGLQPQLVRCIGCNQAISNEETLFDARRGGVICSLCRGSARPNGILLALGMEARRALEHAQSISLERSADLSLSTAVNAACRDALVAFIQDRLGHPLKSLAFIAKLNAVHA